ncbi:DUF523 domain-containing protein [Actinobacillus sp. GY-402]|nr:DUF523 domain-containing protein [Actinobacillus sp. GY-402]
MKKILISACLLGENVKYNGGNNFAENLVKLLEKYAVEIVLICPEVMSGLPTPRPPAEIRQGDIITITGSSVLSEFQQGANLTLQKANSENINIAVLKEKSPSCGSHYVYDGNFANRLIKGEGLTTQLLRQNGIKVFSENDLSELERLFQNT